jgi:multiple sugar transport system substrate-binding protein
MTLLLTSFAACQQVGEPAFDPPATTSAPPVSPTSAPKSSGEVTIHFATYENAVPTFERLAEEFHDFNPDIRVRVVPMPQVGSLPSMEELLYQTVSEADTGLFWIDPTATRYGLVRDLAPFIDADVTFEPDDFYPQLLDIHRWDGGTWALPCCLGLKLIYYNRQAFRDAGVSYPEAGWTLDDFLRTAQQLTLREDDTVQRYGFVDLANTSFEGFVLSQVSSLTDPASGLPALDTQEVAQALQWTTDLALLHGVMPNPYRPSPTSPREIVESGQAAIWSYSLGSTYSSDMQISDIGAVPFPEATRPSNPGSFNGYFMSSGTRHPHESWRWLKFLTHKQIALWDPLAPTRRSVADKTHYWEQFEPEEAAAAQYAAERLSLFTWDEAGTTLYKALRQALEGADVATALAQAQEEALELREEWADVTPRVVEVLPRELAPSMDKPSIAFAPPYYMTDRSAWTAIAEAFNREHPDLTVNIVHRTAEVVDCLVDPVPVLKNTGAPVQFLNLQPLLERDDRSSLEEVPTHFGQAVQHQGSLWGLPFQAHVYVITYNRDLFDAAGEAYPQPGWTLDDFLRTAQRLTRGSGDARQWGYVTLNAPSQDLLAFLALQDVQLWDADGQPRFDAPEVVRAVTWYTDLALKHGVMPGFAGDFAGQTATTAAMQRALVSGGRAAMWSSYTDQDPGTHDFAVGMAPLPVNQRGRGIGVYRYEAFFITSQTRYVEACWEWIQHLSTIPEVVRGVPARPDMLDSPALATRLGEEAVAAYRTTLAYKPLTPLSLSESAQIRWLYEAVDEVLAGASPEEALGDAQRQAQR